MFTRQVMSSLLSPSPAASLEAAAVVQVAPGCAAGVGSGGGLCWPWPQGHSDAQAQSLMASGSAEGRGFTSSNTKLFISCQQGCQQWGCVSHMSHACPSAWTQGGWLQGMGLFMDKRQNCGWNFLQTTFLCRVASHLCSLGLFQPASSHPLSSCPVPSVIVAPVLWLCREKDWWHWVSSALGQLPKSSLRVVVPQVLSGIPEQS